MQRVLFDVNFNRYIKQALLIQKEGLTAKLQEQIRECNNRALSMTEEDKSLEATDACSIVLCKLRVHEYEILSLHPHCDIGPKLDINSHAKRDLFHTGPYGSEAWHKEEEVEAWDKGIAGCVESDEDNQPPHT